VRNELFFRSSRRASVSSNWNSNHARAGKACSRRSRRWPAKTAFPALLWFIFAVIRHEGGGKRRIEQSRSTRHYIHLHAFGFKAWKSPVMSFSAPSYFTESAEFFIQRSLLSRFLIPTHVGDHEYFISQNMWFRQLTHNKRKPCALHEGVLLTHK